MSEMIIGYDAKRLFRNFTGLGNYARGTVRNLIDTQPDLRAVLYTPAYHPHAVTAWFENHPRIQVRARRGLFSRWAHSFCLARNLKKENISIFHGLAHELPMGIQKTGIPSIVTMHDLIYLKYPHLFSPIDNKIFDFKFRHACAAAAAVIAVSEATKADLVAHYGLAPVKIEVIHPPCDDAFFQTVPPAHVHAVLAKHRLPREYFLYVGAIIQRKQLGEIIRAMAKIKPADRLPLVAVGQGRAYLKEVRRLIARHRLASSVHIISNAASTDLPALYAGARFLCYPSIYEGFGIPLVEARAQKKAIITSNVSSLPEAAGGGGMLVDPRDNEALADAITRLTLDSTYREDLARAGQASLETLRPPQLSARLMDLYRRVHG